MLAALADANTADRQEAMVASRDVSGKPHRSSVSASVAIVPASGRGGEYRVHGIYQRECDATCGELRRQRGAHREWGQLQILCGGRDAGGRPRLTYSSDGPYQGTSTPKSLDHKFITEDVPTGLIPMSALGAAVGVGTPAIDALIEVVRSMTGKDFAAGGRTLEHLGIGGMDTTQIGRVVDEGF